METKNFKLVNCDTDSISFSKKNGDPFSEEEQENLLKELNSLFPEKIKWEHDGIYPKVIVLKSKNYITYDGKKIKAKGSALRSSKTEKALKEFMNEIIEALVFDRQNTLVDIYHKYVKEIHNIQDISRWSSKKTITEAVLNPERTNEQKVLDALEGQKVQPGDKYYMYFTETKALKLAGNWRNDVRDEDKVVLLNKLYKTIVIFKNVIDLTQFPKYHLKNKKIKEELETVLGKYVS